MEQLSQNETKNNSAGTSYKTDLLPLSTHGILIEYKLIRFYNKKTNKIQRLKKCQNKNLFEFKFALKMDFKSKVQNKITT